MTVNSTGYGVVIIQTTSNIGTLPVYNNHAEAVADGLTDGDLYKLAATNDGETKNLIAQVTTT